MNQDDQDFAALRRVLVLKRHEQPPPGYFNAFSGQVIARIKAGEGAGDSVFQRFLRGAALLRQFWDAIERKPIAARAFGAGVCALFVAGVAYSEMPERQPTLAGSATTTNHLHLARSKPAGEQGPFDRYPRLSDPVVQGVPEPTGTFINVDLPDAN